jgi:hypothetical protein
MVSWRRICLHPPGRFPALIQTLAEFVIVTGGALVALSLGSDLAAIP